MNLKYYLRGLGIGIIMTSLIMGIASGDGKEALTDSEIKERARALGMTEEKSVLADLVDDDVFLSPSPSGLEASSSQPEVPLDGEASSGGTASPSGSGQDVITPSPARTPKDAITPSPVVTPKDGVSPSPGITATSSPTPRSVPSPSAAASASPSASPSTAAMPTPKPVNTPVPTPTATPGKASEGTDVEEEGILIQVVSGDTSFSVSKKLEEAGLITSADEFDRYLCENGYDRRINVGEFRILQGTDMVQIARKIARLEE